MSVLAKVGDKIEFKTNYNTEAMFEFENKLKLKYEGKEDEIIKLIEAGDVTLPLSSTLIQGSQSLFGIKLNYNLEDIYNNSFSEQKGETQSIQVSGGAQTNQFYFKADMYEENKHFFISQYFRDNYNQFLEDLPLISSPINIKNRSLENKYWCCNARKQEHYSLYRPWRSRAKQCHCGSNPNIKYSR